MSDSNQTPTATEPNDDDLKELLAKRQHARPNKLTWVLLVALVLALGFAMGACVQKGVSTATNGSMNQPPIAVDPSGVNAGPPAGRPGDFTIGTVESIEGSTMTIATPDGRTITVVVPDGTSITSTVEVTLADIPVGSDVIVRGTEGDDGTLTADSVTEGTGRFPAGGRPGGGLRPAP